MHICVMPESYREFETIKYGIDNIVEWAEKGMKFFKNTNAELLQSGIEASKSLTSLNVVGQKTFKNFFNSFRRNTGLGGSLPSTNIPMLRQVSKPFSEIVLQGEKDVLLRGAIVPLCTSLSTYTLFKIFSIPIYFDKESFQVQLSYEYVGVGKQYIILLNDIPEKKLSEGKYIIEKPLPLYSIDSNNICELAIIQGKISKIRELCNFVKVSLNRPEFLHVPPVTWYYSTPKSMKILVFANNNTFIDDIYLEANQTGKFTVPVGCHAKNADVYLMSSGEVSIITPNSKIESVSNEVRTEVLDNYASSIGTNVEIKNSGTTLLIMQLICFFFSIIIICFALYEGIQYSKERKLLKNLKNETELKIFATEDEKKNLMLEDENVYEEPKLKSKLENGSDTRDNNNSNASENEEKSGGAKNLDASLSRKRLYPTTFVVKI